jgi:hypothetical protein
MDPRWRGKGESIDGEGEHGMTEGSNAQQDAASAAAEARRVIATRIAELAVGASKVDEAETIALLAEAYANLASEPPRVRV